MALIEAPMHEPFIHGRQIYVRAPKPVHFPSEERPEEHVSETKRHLEARTTLYLLLKDALDGAAIGSDQFVYSDATDPHKCLSPDVFVKRGVPDSPFESWKVWERGAPDLAVEIISASDRRDEPWSEKVARYQESGINELVRFDPTSERAIRVWDRVDGELVERAATSPDLRACQSLGLWWMVTSSAYGPLLRLARERDGSGLLPTPNEEGVRLAQELAEERKARSLAEHDRRLAEHDKRLAEEAKTLAEEAKTLAEEAKTLAEQGKRRVEEKLLASEAEAGRLRAELARLRGEQP